jgi:hypothetical protein
MDRELKATEAFILQVCVLAGTIRDVKEGAPEGALYSGLMMKYPNMTADEFRDLIALLEKNGAIRRSGYLCFWRDNERWNKLLDSLDEAMKAVQARK